MPTTNDRFKELIDTLIEESKITRKKFNSMRVSFPSKQLVHRMRNIQSLIKTQAILMQEFKTKDISSIAKTVNAQVPILPKNLILPVRTQVTPSANSSLEVYNQDILELAASYPTDEVTLIQNPGNPKLPGGYYGIGSNALEEQLCFHSDLAFRLAPPYSGFAYCNTFIQTYIQDCIDNGITDVNIIAENFFGDLDSTQSAQTNAQQWFKTFTLAAKQTAKVTAPEYYPPYLRNVAFVMPNYEIRFFDVETSFGMDLSQHLIKPSDKKIKERTRAQFRHLYKSADTNGAQHICAVALGCGSFKNNPEIVAKAIKKVNLPNATVCFAIAEKAPQGQLGQKGKIFDEILNPHKYPKKIKKLTPLKILAGLSILVGAVLFLIGLILILTGVFSPMATIAVLIGTTFVLSPPAALLLANIAIWSTVSFAASIASMVVGHSMLYLGRKGRECYLERDDTDYHVPERKTTFEIDAAAYGDSASYNPVHTQPKTRSRKNRQDDTSNDHANLLSLNQ